MVVPHETNQVTPPEEPAGFDVLLIEDDHDIRNVLQIILQRSGYTLRCAPEGKSAMRLLTRHTFRLIITDIFMPEMDGIEVIMRNSALSPETPVLVISGGSRRGGCELRAARALGCRKTLTKPFGLKEFMAAVVELTGGPALSGAQLAGKS